MATRYNNELYGGLWITRQEHQKQELLKPNESHIHRLNKVDPFAPPTDLQRILRWHLAC